MHVYFLHTECNDVIDIYHTCTVLTGQKYLADYFNLQEIKEQASFMLKILHVHHIYKNIK